MKAKLVHVGLCEPICANDVEGDFFAESWTQKAFNEGLLNKIRVTDGTLGCDTDEYSLTKLGWEMIRDEISPTKHNWLNHFFEKKCA